MAPEITKKMARALFLVRGEKLTWDDCMGVVLENTPDGFMCPIHASTMASLMLHDLVKKTGVLTDKQRLFQLTIYGSAQIDAIEKRTRGISGGINFHPTKDEFLKKYLYGVAK